LVIRGRGGTCQVVYLINLSKRQRPGDIVPKQLEAAVATKMGHVFFSAREKVIHTDDVMSVVDEACAEVGTYKARSSGY
jgi:hypothetical protein